MAIRNDNLGGTDWSDGEILYAADLNDTFDATAIQLEPIEFSLPSGETYYHFFNIISTTTALYITTSGVKRTTDNGSNWSDVITGATARGYLHTNYQNTNYVIYINTTDDIYKYSADGGSTWSDITLPSDFSSFFAATITDSGRIYLSYTDTSSGDNVVYTDDGGTNWTSVHTSNVSLVYSPKDGYHIVYDSGKYNFITGDSFSSPSITNIGEPTCLPIVLDDDNYILSYKDTSVTSNRFKLRGKIGGTSVSLESDISYRVFKFDSTNKIIGQGYGYDLETGKVVKNICFPYGKFIVANGSDLNMGKIVLHKTSSGDYFAAIWRFHHLVTDDLNANSEKYYFNKVYQIYY